MRYEIITKFVAMNLALEINNIFKYNIYN